MEREIIDRAPEYPIGAPLLSNNTRFAAVQVNTIGPEGFLILYRESQHELIRSFVALNQDKLGLLGRA